MFSYQEEPGSSGYRISHGPFGTPPPAPRRYSLVTFVLAVIGASILALASVGLIFWLIGFAFHVLGFLLKVALIVALASFFWRRLTGRRRGGCV